MNKVTRYFVLGKVVQNVPDGVSEYQPFYQKEYNVGDSWYPTGIATIEISNRAGTISASYEILGDRGFESRYLDNGDSIQVSYLIVGYSPVAFVPKKPSFWSRLTNLLFGNPCAPTWPAVSIVPPNSIKFQRLDSHIPVVSG